MLAILFGQLAGAGTLMAEQPGLMPTGISRKQFAALVEHASRSEAFDRRNCVVESSDISMIRDCPFSQPNRQFATGNSHRRSSRVASLGMGVDHERTSQLVWWSDPLFADSRDNEHDFSSAIGFEDDAEVLNACLKHAGRTSMCITIEDFDNA